MRRCPMAMPIALLVASLCGCDSPQSVPPQRFEVANPYDRAGSWHRGNFHVHTSHSDGSYTGEELVALYQAAGYGVLCITDHNQYGDQDGGIVPALQTDSLLHDWNGDGLLQAENVFGSGVEAYVRDWSSPPPEWAVDRWVQPTFSDHQASPALLAGVEATHHGMHIGVVGCPVGWVEGPDADLGFLQRARAVGGFAYLAHPAEWNGNPEYVRRQLPLGELAGLEIVNGLWLSRQGRADATPLWDQLLAQGQRLWGLANDDAHTFVGDAEAPPFTAYNMLRTDDPSPTGFLQALHDGAFYASTGLGFTVLELHGDSLVVEAPGAERLRFIGRNGSALLEAAAARATYVIGGLEGYVRVHADAPPDSGRTWRRGAWSQPFFIQLLPPH